MKTSFALIAWMIVTALFALDITPTAARASQAQKPYQSASSGSSVKITSKPSPRYPREARKQQIQGTIVLRAIFTSSGQVTDIKFREAIPSNLPQDIVKLLTKESIKAARKIKFEPATKDGRPVSMYIQLEYEFRLED